MGRPRKYIDEIKLLDMRTAGMHLKEISQDLGISVTTISRRLAVLQHNKGVLTKYRQLQGLQLTDLQARILDAADSRNLKDASLSLIDLLRTFHVLKRLELKIEGKESCKVWGLMSHLLALQKAEKEESNG